MVNLSTFSATRLVVKQKGVCSCQQTLRTADCKDREPSVNGPFGKSVIFCPKIPFGDLFLKLILKGSSEFQFLRNSGKFENPVKVRFFVQ